MVHSLDITLPANVTASIHIIGATNLETVTEGGGPATNAVGLIATPVVTNGTAVFQLGSGRYKFKAPMLLMR
jgi:hypothetical protein